jgi:hypothetical protein
MDGRDLQEKLIELQDEVRSKSSTPGKHISFLQLKQEYLTRSYSLPLKHQSLLCSTT